MNNAKKLFRTQIDLSPEKRQKVIALLNQTLADTSDLASQVKHAHWNVKGMQFIALHELFDKLHAGLLEIIDVAAERVTAFGGTAAGTVRMAAAHSKLSEFPDDLSNGKEVVKTLVDRYGTACASVRKAIDHCEEIGDAGTADLYTGFSQQLDKDLWFLESHLQD